jgi:hypothetical protein
VKELPPIPRFIYLPAGKIPVKRVKGLQANEQCAGKYNFDKRLIEIDAELGLVAAHLTLEHERIHAILFDTGVNETMDDATEEKICNAIAHDVVARMRR